MRVIRRFGLVVAGLLVLSLSACVQEIKQDRVKVALLNAGLSEQLSDCMARRMAQKLTIAQLHRLQALGGPKQSWADYVYSVRQVHDPDAMEVLVSSAALCKAGLIH